MIVRKPKNQLLSAQDIKRYNWNIWKLVFGVFFMVIVLFACASFGLFGALPSFRDLENPKSNQATEILADDGKQVLGTYFIENRSNVTYKDISPSVIHALVATEDNHFFEHSGIDFGRTFTIVAYNLIGKHQGGSTITQQLAKNLFSGFSDNFFKRATQKVQEWIIAVRLEKHYTKEEIITMYLNTVNFGTNTFGIKSAARTYFNTTPDKLQPDQAALLVQILKGATWYSPIRNPQRALTRRNFVLGRMAEEGFITKDQAELYQRNPLGVKYTPIDHNEGPAPYFRAVLKKEVQKILVASSIFKPDGVTPYDLDRDGLKIYTTINYTMQQYAEGAQQEYMRNLQGQFNDHWKGVNKEKTIKNYQLLLDQGMKRSDRYKQLKAEGRSPEEITANFDSVTRLNIFTWHGKIDTLMKPIDSIIYCKMLLRNSMMSMDPTTGHIKAWVGGINFEHFKYDQVKVGTRQVGSTAKPFTYSVAIENGYSPCMEVENVPVTISIPGQPDWTPRSSSTETIPGAITLRTALAHSQNWVTASLMKDFGPLPVEEIIKKMGVNSPDIGAYPSICLGVFNASVYDMTAAYSVFANQGTWTEPTFITRIEDKNGNVLYTHQPKIVQALNEQTAYVMTYMLKGVIEEGTGARLRSKYGLTNPIGGKTGTTQDNSDGWFIGITPQLVTGVWTGCEDRDIHFRSTRLGEGANSALPIFALYMQKVYADPELGIKKNIDFALPKAPLSITLDCNAYSQQQQQQDGTKETDKKLSF